MQGAAHACVEKEIFSERFDVLTKDIGHISGRGGSETQGLQLQGEIRTTDLQMVNEVWLGRFGIFFTNGGKKKKKEV